MSMSDDEIIEQRRAIVEACQDPENIHISINQIKDLGISAIATDGTFATVSRVFDKFVLDYKTQFPALSQFLTRWQGSHTVCSLFHHRVLSALALTSRISDLEENLGRVARLCSHNQR